MNQTRTEVKSKRTAIKDNGIMTHVNEGVSSHVPDFDNYTPQELAVMASQGAAKLKAQQDEQDKITLQAQADQAAAESLSRQQANSGTDVTASVAEVVKLTKVITDFQPSSNVAAEIASQVVRANEAAQAAAALPEATPEEITAAQTSDILTTQALADVAKIKLDETIEYHNQVENTAMTLADKAKADDATNDIKIQATLAAQRLKEVNDSLIAAQSLHDDAKQLASETKAKAESDAVTVAEAISVPTTITKEVKKLSFLDQVTEYIYKLIY
jgi:hypothetical protein